MERDVNTSTIEASSADLNTNPADVSNVGRAYHRKRNCKIIVDSPADFASSTVFSRDKLSSSEKGKKAGAVSVVLLLA